MKLIVFLIVGLVICSVVFMSGCTSTGTQTNIKNQEDVSKVVTNISSDVQDVSDILDDIDTKLG